MESTAFDSLAIGCVCVLGIIGFIRGFTKQFFGTLGWLGALLVTIYGYAPMVPLVKKFVDTPWVTSLLTITLLFLPSYIFLKALSSWLSRKIKDSFLDSLDRVLGAFWGLLVGILSTCFVFIVLETLWPEGLSSATRAKTYPIIKKASLFIMDILPEGLDNGKLKKDLSPSSQQKADILSSMRPISVQLPLKQAPNRALYSNQQRQSLTNLLSG